MDNTWLMNLQREGQEASADVRLAVNDAIAKYHLSGDATLCMFARLAGTFIHGMQRVCPDAKSRDEVEDLFHDMLDTYLALLDNADLQAEMERERMKNLN